MKNKKLCKCGNIPRRRSRYCRACDPKRQNRTKNPDFLSRKNLMPFLKTGKYSDYLKTPYWHELRKRALDHFGKECRSCGSTERLQVHHKHYQLMRECWDDLEILCRGCHKDEHPEKIKYLDDISREYQQMFGGFEG